MEDERKILPDVVYSAKEVAVLLGLKERTIIEYCKHKKIKAVKAQKYLILGSNLLTFLNGE